MKKTFLTLCLTVLLTLPLAGCTATETSSNPTVPASPSPSATAVTSGNGLPPPNIAGTLPPAENSAVTDGQNNLAGSDGVVSSDTDADNADNNTRGRSGRSTLERAGNSIRDTVDDIGPGVENAIDGMGRGIRRAADRMGRNARDMGLSAQRALQ